MKKLMVLAVLFAIGCVFMPKAQALTEPWGFGIYNGATEPADYAIPGATLGSKTGKASCKTVMGIVTWGDCSIKVAMKNGKISRVTAADWEKKFILIYGHKTLRVYGN